MTKLNNDTIIYIHVAILKKQILFIKGTLAPQFNEIMKKSQSKKK